MFTQPAVKTNEFFSMHMLIVTLCEKIGHNNHLTLSECNDILHLKSRDIYLFYI